MNAASGATLSTAEIIAVGTELLTPFRVDTNSLFLVARLNEQGIVVRRKSVVGDDRCDLGAAVREALTRVDLVVVCGGLGPTEDDLTRETVAEILGRALREDTEIAASLRARFAGRGWTMPENNRRQARVPDGAVVLSNSRGTAPGLWLEENDRVILLLPGPPRELEPMFLGLVKTRLRVRATRNRLYSRVLCVGGRGESHVEELAQPVYSRWRNSAPSVETTVLASPGLVELHLSTRTASRAAAESVLEAAATELKEVLGNDVFSTDGQSLPEVVGGLLERKGLYVAIGESCTGGLVAASLIDVPGSSRYVRSGVIAYDNDVKMSVLSVPPELLDSDGAVSESVALAMAEGARRLVSADVGIGVTGVAGPGGGSEMKPVGTVCVGVVGPGDKRQAKTVQLPGDRGTVRRAATRFALDLLRRTLQREGAGHTLPSRS